MLSVHMPHPFHTIPTNGSNNNDDLHSQPSDRATAAICAKKEETNNALQTTQRQRCQGVLT